MVQFANRLEKFNKTSAVFHSGVGCSNAHLEKSPKEPPKQRGRREGMNDQNGGKNEPCPGQVVRRVVVTLIAEVIEAKIKLQ